MSQNKQSEEEIAYESSESSLKSSIKSSKSPSPLINSRSFRINRGANIQKLLDKENLAEADPDEFWQKNKYFGEIEEIEASDEEEYEKESSIKDQYDSDFFSKSHETEENPDFFAKDPEEEDTSEKRAFFKKKIEKKPLEIAKKAYIHEFFSQEELLKEAALTEILNKRSLEDLVRLEEEKKKRNLFSRIETDSPKMKLIDSFKRGFHEQNLYFSDEKALETEMAGLRNKENVMNLEEKLEFLEKKREIKNRFRYRDPETKERFNTLEEAKILIKKVQKVKKSKLKAMIKAHKNLLEKKLQAFNSLK